MSRAGEVQYPWTDAELLAALQLRDDGLMYAEIGKRLGRSKSAVCGALARIDADLRAADTRPVSVGAACGVAPAVTARAPCARASA